MFSRLATAFSNAVDALAPPLPLHEEFLWHWTAIMKFYTDRNSNSKKPIELTGLAGRLEEMSKILEQEEAELGSDNMGPCMEYFLQHKMLEQMSALSRADTPPGIKKCVLVFTTRLLSNSKQVLLPQMGIYTAVQKLIGLCGEVLAAPTEREEAGFLNVICQKIRADPSILTCFLPRVLEERHCTSIVNGKQPDGGCGDTSAVSFPLLRACLTLMESADSDVSTLAAECLILCMSNLGDDVARYVIAKSNMCSSVVHHLVKLYCAIPRTLKAADIDEAVTSWCADTVASCGSTDHQVIAPGKRKLLCFFKWLGFTDTLVELSNALIGAELGKTFLDEFLQGPLLDDFTKAESEESFLFITSLVTTCLRNLNSKDLVVIVGSFLLGDQKGSRASPKDMLLERGRDPNASPQLVLATLQAFEELLQRPSKEILDILLLSHLVGRNYQNDFAAEVFDFSDDDEEGLCNRAGKANMSDFEISPGSSPVSRTFAPAQIHRILNCFLMLLPDEIKSCEETDSGYDAYISDAHRQYQDMLAVTDGWEWPSEPVREEQPSAEDDQSSDSQPEADSLHRSFYEGPFLSMLLDRIENMHRQPYDVNLLVTSLISRLALFAHPNLHEYLLNPLLPLVPGARSLFSALLKVVEEIQVAVHGMENLKRKLMLTRNALLNDSGDDCTLGEESGVLEAIIVLEEFCKELAAVAFVKYHAAA
nr:FHF complex subunit HOOK interacting protein 2A-like [Dermacentor andersoni]